MMKSFWILFIITSSLNSYSQFGKFSIDVNDAIIKQNELASMRDGKNQLIDLSETKGTPYYRDFFSSGVVYAESTDESLGYQMRYNIYNDQIEVQNSDDNSIVAINKNPNFLCKILEDSFKYLEYKNKNDVLTGGYFQVLSEGKTTLLLKYDCEYQPEKVGNPPVFKVTPAKFITKKTYYLLSEDKLTLISTKKKKFLEIFSEYKGQVNNYINRNNLNTNKDRDIIRIIAYYNSLF